MRDQTPFGDQTPRLSWAHGVYDTGRVDETERFLDAVQRGKADEVSKLLDGDPRLLEAEREGVSALRVAVYHGHPDVARIFVERGARLDVFDASAIGETARLSELLAEDRSLANAFAADGFTPLGLASFFAHPAAARMLLANGAQVNVPSRNAQRVAPIHSAVAGGDVEIVRDLLASGADVHARESGFTPLHGAAAEGNAEMVRLLLAYAADPEARSDTGKTPADMARERGHETVADLLRLPPDPG
jgi:ankyrin repeat protein